MNDILGWASIVVALGMVPLLLITAFRHVLSRRSVEDKYEGMPGGIAGGFDAVWSPLAHEAGQERDRQHRASVPAPTPDKGPGVLGSDGRIVIAVDQD